MMWEKAAELVEKANASAAHTTLVFKEIAERCAKFTPTHRAFDLSKALDDELERYLDGVFGVCEASSFEQHALWREYVHRPEEGYAPMTWEQKGGYLPTIGTINDMPVTVCLSIVVVNGIPILFYESPSRVTDHDMVRACIEEARALGLDGVLLVGDPPYFSRFGFELALDAVLPGPVDRRRVMWLPLTEAAPVGAVRADA